MSVKHGQCMPVYVSLLLWLNRCASPLMCPVVVFCSNEIAQASESFVGAFAINHWVIGNGETRI